MNIINDFFNQLIKPVKVETTVELSIAPNYVNWGIWECIRELIQNAKDADDLGYKMEINYDLKYGILEIISKDISLSRESLVLGSTTKRGTSARGQFGEGYKLAIASLLNKHYKVEIYNAEEIWKPKIKHSVNFNCNILSFDIIKNSNNKDLKFVICFVNNDEWEMVKKNLLFLGENDKKIHVSNKASVLIDAIHKNKLFSKGIWISSLPDNYYFGYDLSNIRLDRDRSMADPWTIRSAISECLNEASVKNYLPTEVLYDLFNKETGEAVAFREFKPVNKPELHEKLFEYFKARYGKDAVPVGSEQDFQNALLIGMTPILCNHSLIVIFANGGFSFDSFRKTIDTGPKKFYSLKDLSEEEKENLKWAYNKTNKFEPTNLNNIYVVDFYRETICGSYYYDGGVHINIAKKILTDRAELIATLVHEVSHKYGADHSQSHRAACERIFSNIIADKAL